MPYADAAEQYQAPQRIVLNSREDILKGRAEVLGIAAVMVRGTGLPEDADEAVYEWARVCGLQLVNAIDKQVHSESVPRAACYATKRTYIEGEELVSPQ